MRRLGAIAFNLMCRDVAGGIADTQCGFKFLTGPLARAVAADLATTGFAFDVELLMRCAQRGVPVRDVPVHWHDVPGSTFSVRRHAVECLRDVIRLRAAAHSMAPATDAWNPAPHQLSQRGSAIAHQADPAVNELRA